NRAGTEQKTNDWIKCVPYIVIGDGVRILVAKDGVSVALGLDLDCAAAHRGRIQLYLAEGVLHVHENGGHIELIHRLQSDIPCGEWAALVHVRQELRPGSQRDRRSGSFAKKAAGGV